MSFSEEKSISGAGEVMVALVEDGMGKDGVTEIMIEDAESELIIWVGLPLLASEDEEEARDERAERADDMGARAGATEPEVNDVTKISSAEIRVKRDACSAFQAACCSLMMLSKLESMLARRCLRSVFSSLRADDCIMRKRRWLLTPKSRCVIRSF